QNLLHIFPLYRTTPSSMCRLIRLKAERRQGPFAPHAAVEYGSGSTFPLQARSTAIHQSHIAP
ncbi:MAG TPA: hypothetical protein VIH59_01960, partial [Candidatus Tectomicrobia bacterium]